MILSPKCIRTRSLHHLTVWVCIQPTAQVLLVSNRLSNLQPSPRIANPRVSCHRSFSWGRKRHWSSCHSPGPYRAFGYRSRALEGDRCTSLRQDLLANRRRSIGRHPLDDGWRLSSSWGRHGYRWGDSGPPSAKDTHSNEDRQDNRLHKHFQSECKAMEKDFEEFKRMVDADPVGMLFGYSTWKSARNFHNEKNGYGENSSIKRASSSAKEDAPKYSESSQVANDCVQAPEAQYFTETEINASVREKIQAEDFEFDPISMRNVPKSSHRAAPTAKIKNGYAKSQLSVPVDRTINAAHKESEIESSFQRSEEVPSENVSSSDLRDASQSHATQLRRDWLAQEGFRARNPKSEPSKSGSTPKQLIEDIYMDPSKIETALDSHLKPKRRTADDSTTTKPALKYKAEEAEEGTTEDVDQLRASDLRASAGLSGRLPKEKAKENYERRSTLENGYEKRSQSLDAQIIEELMSQKARLAEPHNEPSPPSGDSYEFGTQQSERLSQPEVESKKKIAAENLYEGEVNGQEVANHITEFRSDDDELLKLARQVERESRGKHAPNTRGEAFPQPPSQIRPTTKPHAIGSKFSAKYENSENQEIDRLEVLRIVRKLVHTLRQTQRLFQDLQRQHQRKYPDAAIPSNLLQSSKAFEQHFTQTLRGAWAIFKSGVESPALPEDGIRKADPSATPASPAPDDGINPKAKPALPEESIPTEPDLYRILAYDPTIQRVSTAKITSLLIRSVDDNTPNLLKAISKLTAPAKFLPHLAPLQKSGYELVSGSPTVLVFKKVRPAKQSTPNLTEEGSIMDERYPRHTNPIDGTTTPTGNFASPTGFVNHDAPILPTSEDDRYTPSYHDWSSKANHDPVHRKEKVFSDSRLPRWQDRRDEGSSGKTKSKSQQWKTSKRKRILKRMLWVGVWVAGCSYALGVTSEFMKPS